MLSGAAHAIVAGSPVRSLVRCLDASLSFVVVLATGRVQFVSSGLAAVAGDRGLEHSEVGRIVDLRTGQAIDPRQLVERLAPAERVIVGERHDNPDHHSLQLWLLQALAHERAQGSVLLEMIVPAQQARVDQARADLARGDRPADLPARLDWSEGWPWNLYGSLVSYALAQPYPLLAANLDRSEIVELYRSPVPIPGRASSRRAVIEALTAQIVQSHCGMLPDTQVPAMVGIQQQRDRRMAERLLPRRRRPCYWRAASMRAAMSVCRCILPTWVGQPHWC